ncbi:MAG: ribosomal protein [Chloroflexota bacterium]|nr:ribosomal protein [Chloroflexota bacterium]
MTEEQQGGTAPEPEAIASEETPASEETVAAIDVADEPAAPETSPEPVLTSEEDVADAPPAAEEEDEEPAPVVRRTGPEPTTMEELLAEQDTDIKSFKHGDVVEGTVVRIDKDEMLVDIGAKSEGVVSNRELFGRHGESQPEINIGDVVLVYVLQPESPEGHVVLSLRRAGLERKWRSMQEVFEAGTIIDAPVIDHNKGGLIVDCGIRGFVPISQIVDFPRRPQNEQPRDAAQEIAEKLQPYIGRKLRLKILEVNRKANRLILSEKVALYEERREKRDELFSSLQVGQKVTGSVRSIAPFGIFIDLGGIDGLVHKSELSWNKVNNPEAGYKVGDEVEAEVIDINHERGRISLSIRRLQPDPWESTVADFKVGDVIDGTVTKLVNFGAFVRVREGLEGLIHISELSHQRVAHPGDVVHEGQVLKLKIISLDSERHRLGLSLKQAEEAPVRPVPEAGTMQAPTGERRERRERRERPDRGYTPSDTQSEPEGGIDTTLAAAFAQVRNQLAAAEAAGTPAPAPTADAEELVAEAFLADAVAGELAEEAVEAESEAVELAEEAIATEAVAEELAEDAEAAEAVADDLAEDAVAVEAEAVELATEAIAAEGMAEELTEEAVAAETAADELAEDAVEAEAESVELTEEAIATEVVAEELAAEAFVAEELGDEAVADELTKEAIAAEVVAEELATEAFVADAVAEELAAESFAAEAAAEELVEEAVEVEVIAEELASEAIEADAVAEELAAESFVAETVAEELAIEAVVAEVEAVGLAEDAVVADAVADQLATEAVAEEAVAEELLEEAVAEIAAEDEAGKA